MSDTVKRVYIYISIYYIIYIMSDTVKRVLESGLE